jgi:hypothetical protein
MGRGRLSHCVWRAVELINRSNLDDATTVDRVKAGCLGIDLNLSASFAHRPRQGHDHWEPNAACGPTATAHHEREQKRTFGMSRNFRMATSAVMLALLATGVAQARGGKFDRDRHPFPAMSAAHAHRQPHPGMAAISCLGSNRKLATCAPRTR